MGNFDEAYVSGIGTAAVRLNNHGSQMKGFPGAGRVFFLMWNHTVDGSGIPKNHLAWNGAKTLKIMVDKLPTSTGFHAGVQPSTVWPHLIKIPRCLLVEPCDREQRGLGFSHGPHKVLLLLWFVVVSHWERNFLCHFYNKHLFNLDMQKHGTKDNIDLSLLVV